MIIQLEPDELIYLITERIKTIYNTPNVSIVDKSLKKLHKLSVFLQIVPQPNNRGNMDDLVGQEAMAQLAQRMRVEEEPETINPDFVDSAL